MSPLARFSALAALLVSACAAAAALPASPDMTLPAQAATDPTPDATGTPDRGEPGTPSETDTSASETDRHFVVVTFANNPFRPAARAGSNGRRYSTRTYGIARDAHINAERVATAYSLTQVISWPIKELGVHCVVYEIPDARPMAEVLAALAKDPRVTLAQPLQEFRTLTSDEDRSSANTTYNDPLYGLQTNLVSLGISAAHEHAQGAGVRIGLIDTGVDRGHPDLHERVAGSHSFLAAGLGAPPQPPGGASFYRHGTAMAGVIAAVANNKLGIVGIAPQAQIEVFEACWQLKPNSDAAACNTFTLAQALAAALEARTPLINLSIAGPSDPLLSALVQSGLKRGVIFIGAASAQPRSFPANIQGVISVGNSDPERGARSTATLYAPGTHVMTTLPDAQYDFESGTSVATAEITGVVALLLSADARLNAESVVSLLNSTGPSPQAGINVDAALAKIEADRTGSRLARSR